MELKDGIYEFDSIEEMYDFLDRTIQQSNDYIYEKIRNCIDKNDSEFELFRINNNSDILNVIVGRENLISPLKKCIDKFIEFEQYEMCTECTNYIKILEEEYKQKRLPK